MPHSAFKGQLFFLKEILVVDEKANNKSLTVTHGLSFDT